MQLVHSAAPAVPRDRLLRLPEVEALTGIKKSSIYDLMKRGQFPPCIRISRRLTCWPESAVLTWINVRIRKGAAQ
ncbi:MAG: AlpA family phage regulatory protein [Burkholderiales bacterium]|nr:AlpA family phage regulatory protein [Burkholderiales bacterium]MBK8667045.1 AlpA family phage regulatory protein [Burkholderiales bacterium]